MFSCAASKETSLTASRPPKRIVRCSTVSNGIGWTAVLTACCRSLSRRARSEEHTSELQSLMRISYAVFCLKKKKPLVRAVRRSLHHRTGAQNTTHNQRATERCDTHHIQI